MRKLLFLLPLAVALFACSEKEDVAGGPGSITTNGLAYADGRPASYATVALRKVDFRSTEAVEENALVVADTYADESGNFKVDIPAEGKYRLTVLHDGVAYSRVVTRDGFAEVGVSTAPDTVDLLPTAVVAGVVDIPEGSSAVWVGVVGTDVLVKTDSVGWFALSALPANDSLKLYFMSEDYSKNLGERSIYVTPRESLMKDYRSEVKVPVDTSAKDTADIDTVVPDTVRLPQVVALFKDGSPAAGATVALRKADARVEELAVQNMLVEPDFQTDKNGRFDMKWPTSGDYRLTVEKDGYAFSSVYSAKELAKLDTLHLVAKASISSKVTLQSSAEYLWVGVYGLDMLVKTNNVGSYVLPNVPANDTLDIYFVTADSSSALYAEWSAFAEPNSTETLSPVKVLQDFENGADGWYINTDSLNKGTTIKPAQFATDGVEYDSTRKSNVFHGDYKLANDDYAWVLVGTSFEHYMNFAVIDSVVFYAKGNGSLKLAIENWVTPTVNIKASTAWLKLSSKWQRIVVNPADLCVGSANEESCVTSWNSMMGGVKQFHLFAQDGTDFYIDDVTLYGALF
ncbi:carboxypeptidase-like regulatory domain-containing protein [uncultured Fibrobacter sp.]|uniref:carboxypeptidase-like regulatory domain-containing protein n=1 Tax=uncultured Fibrobacter sp. TaxID=261512 RepID=UPI00261C8E85|nr:carboxypeptidase-like regulatory domain-containing protein [uncultured Fibrobacter sp.]